MCPLAGSGLVRPLAIRKGCARLFKVATSVSAATLPGAGGLTWPISGAMQDRLSFCVFLYSGVIRKMFECGSSDVYLHVVCVIGRVFAVKV